MNKNAVIRIVLTLLGLPLILALSVWDLYRFFPMFLLILAFSAFGAHESAILLKSKGFVINPYLPTVLGFAFPILAYLENWGVLKPETTLVVLALLIVAIFIRQIFANTEQNLEPVLGKITGILFVLIYPGFFMYFLVKILALSSTTPLMAVFCLATFGNDALAWVFGTLWGKKSWKPFHVSPTKSLVGFAGGIFGTLLALGLAAYYFPGSLGTHWIVVGAAALVLSLTTIVGDLFESSLKRSAGVKDSGSLIPGRGGVLDSVDSLLFSAPVFYAFLLFGRW
ncbi:MAG: phosphatidate cytidylyltransferase [Spirochaetales bacterium]